MTYNVFGGTLSLTQSINCLPQTAADSHQQGMLAQLMLVTGALAPGP